MLELQFLKKINNVTKTNLNKREENIWNRERKSKFLRLFFKLKIIINILKTQT